ncbi:MAG: peroxide stress protein YaaA [Solirubrobacterales bacterium]
MLVLLPPSEAKADPPPGSPPVDLAALAHPQLTSRRERLIGVLGKTSAGNQSRALTALGLTTGQAGELERNVDLLTAPTAPAADVYTGVLYRQLDLASLGTAARARAAERLFVASALWGVVGLDDRIPAYRLSIGAKLPRIGGLARFWRPALTKALSADGLLVDLRSQSYAAAWRPGEAAVVETRVFVETGGHRKVITHMAKATRGEIARVLAKSRDAAVGPEDVAARVERAGFKVELSAPSAAAKTWRLDVIRDNPY